MKMEMEMGPNYNKYDEFGEMPYKIKRQNCISFKNMIKGYRSLNKTTMKYTYLIMLLGLGYEFFSNRALSNRVNELQGKVDNLYQKINNSKKDNEVLNKK